MKPSEVEIGQRYRMGYKHDGWCDVTVEVIRAGDPPNHKDCFLIRDVQSQRTDTFNALWLNVIQPTVGASALNTQQGGGHYKDLKIQPVEYIHGNNIPYLEGNVIKYVTRWRNKNGVEDLLKAKHYIDLIIEMESKETK